MSYTQYSQYGGNPYNNAGDAEQGYAPQNDHMQPPPAQHEMSNYSASSSNYGNNNNYGAPPVHSQVLTLPDFLERVNFAKEQIRQLTSSIHSISTLHQRALSSPDQSLTQQLESIVTDTQLKNTQIRDQIKYLEADTLKTQDEGLRSSKAKQAKFLKDTFESELKSYQQEELNYRQRYREQIARQYRIVNPDASEDDVRQASEMDWSNEGVFQTALKSNRTGQASSVLGNVRARHNELQRIEATLTDLAAMFADMAQIVEAQEDVVVHTEENATKTAEDVNNANDQIAKASEHARRRRRNKWWCLLIVFVLILIIAAIIAGVVVSKKN